MEECGNGAAYCQIMDAVYGTVPMHRYTSFIRHNILVLKLRTTSSQKCEAVPSRARIQGAQTCASLNSRLEGNKEEEKVHLMLQFYLRKVF